MIGELDRTAAVAWVILGMVGMFVLASCGTTAGLTSDLDRSPNFATYHSFAVVERERRGAPLPWATRAEEDITQELERRGYMRAVDPASADFTVDFVLASREAFDIKSHPVSMMNSGWEVHKYREGTLAITVFDGRTHRRVWHGSSNRELTQKESERLAGPISDAVSSVLAKFPPAPAA